MTKYDNARYFIIKKLNNKYDYEEFNLECFKNEIPSMSMHEYFYKLGLLEWAIRKYSDVDELTAYLKLIEYINQQEMEERSTSNIQQKVGCGSCGGGKVV